MKRTIVATNVAEEASEEVPETSIEELVSEYKELTKQRSSVNARIEYLRDRIIEHYDENTAHEAQTIEVGDWTVQVVDQSRTGLWSRKKLARTYGSEWIKDHLETSWNRRLNVKQPVVVKPKRKRLPLEEE